MAGGLAKVGKPKPAADRFAAADAAMSQAPKVDSYAAVAVEERRPASQSATVKKTLALTIKSVENLRAVDQVLLRHGRKAKEVELVRAAIEHFAQQPDEVILSAFDAVEKLQTGPKR